MVILVEWWQTIKFLGYLIIFRQTKNVFASTLTFRCFFFLAGKGERSGERDQYGHSGGYPIETLGRTCLSIRWRKSHGDSLSAWVMFQPGTSLYVTYPCLDVCSIWFQRGKSLFGRGTRSNMHVVWQKLPGFVVGDEHISSSAFERGKQLFHSVPRLGDGHW